LFWVGYSYCEAFVAEALGMSRTWVVKYDEEPTQPHKTYEKNNMSQRDNLINSNVWGLENGKAVKGDSKQHN